jgi:hypothetical protein
MRPLLALSFILLLAGCLATVPAPTKTVNDLAPASGPLLSFLDPVRVADRRNGQSESFVAVSPDGQTVLTCLHGEFSGPSPMFASTDAGATFRELHATPSPMAGGDCEVAYGADGTWYFMHSTVADGTIAATSDQGKTWTVNFNAAPPTNGLADRPWLDTIGNDAILSYMPLFAEPGPIAFTKSTDHAKTWSTPVHVNKVGPGKTNTMHGHFEVSADGKTIRIPLSQYVVGGSPGSKGTAYLTHAVSRDRGATWKDEPVIGPIETQVDTATAVVTSDGSLVWAYAVPNGPRYDIRLVRSVDDGMSWLAPIAVVGGFTSLGLAWMDARGDGTVDLLLQGDAAPLGGDANSHVILLRLDASRASPLVSSAVLAEASNEYVSIDHDATGRAFLSYKDKDGALLIQRERA